MTSSTPSRCSAPENKAALLDRETALERVDGDTEILASLVSIFLEEIKDMMEAVANSIQKGEASALEKAAHRLKGSVGIFAANSSTDVALQLELMGRNGDMSNAANAYTTLEAQIALLLPALEKFRSELLSKH